jgi:hypothetical protein
MKDDPKGAAANAAPSGSVKRQVEHPRDAAISLRIGSEGDLGTSSSEFIKLGDRLATVFGKGIFEVILPDDVDPARTNLAIRPANQRLLAYGSDDELVSRILLTAKSLFYGRHLVGIDDGAMLLLAFQCLQDLVAARETLGRLTKDEGDAEAAFRSRKQARESSELPSISDIKTRCESFVSRLRHALGCLNEMVVALAGEGVKKRNWMEAVVAMLKAAGGAATESVEHWNTVINFVSLIAELRNVVEHPKEGYQLRCLDYRLGVDNKIAPPTIELVHPKHAFGPAAAVQAMAELLNSFVVAYEDTLAGLCALKVNAEAGKGLRLFVLELTDKDRRNKFVRYGYGVRFPDGRMGVLSSPG